MTSLHAGLMPAREIPHIALHLFSAADCDDFGPHGEILFGRPHINDLIVAIRNNNNKHVYIVGSQRRVSFLWARVLYPITTAPRHHCTPPQLHHDTTAPHHNCTTTPLHPITTAPRQHCLNPMSLNTELDDTVDPHSLSWWRNEWSRKVGKMAKERKVRWDYVGERGEHLNGKKRRADN